jgi:alpha-L-fucosidase
MLRPVRLSHFSNERRDLVWTNHLGGGYQGDTEKSGQFFPAQGYPGRDWECCVKTNNIWGYRSKSARILVGVLIDTPNQGENHLLSINLDSKVNGPVVEVDQLQPVGKCREGNGESIYGADPILFGVESDS